MADPPRPLRTAPIAPMSPAHVRDDKLPATGTKARNPIIGLASASAMLAIVCILYGQIVGFRKPSMTLTPRLTWPRRDKPDDYEMWADDRAVGRIYRIRVSMGLGDRWMWTLFGSEIKGGMIDGTVPHGISDNGDLAQIALARAWERVENHNRGGR